MGNMRDFGADRLFERTGGAWSWWREHLRLVEPGRWGVVSLATHEQGTGMDQLSLMSGGQRRWRWRWHEGR